MHLTADVIVIATGSRPNRPADVPFDDQVLFDSHSILKLPRIPRSLLVLGAGVIGVEYTSIFTALGVEVTLQDTRPELLPYLDREIAGVLEKELSRNGAVVLHDDHYASLERLPGDQPRMRCTTRKGNVLEAEALLYAAGRDGNTRRLNLDAIGLTADARGLLSVNETYQTAHPHIYAVGDVIGFPALASTSMEQGRRAMRHAFGLPGPVGHAPDQLPFAIYAIPEVSYIGESEESARAKSLDVMVGRGRYALNPRAQIVGDTTGILKLLCDADTLRVLGVHVIGHGASELIHTGQAWLARGATAHDVADEIFNYPTLSDLYRHAALEVVAAKARREGRAPVTSLDGAFYLKG
jgi:NAD(P) transhydrogenase